MLVFVQRHNCSIPEVAWFHFLHKVNRFVSVVSCLPPCLCTYAGMPSITGPGTTVCFTVIYLQLNVSRNKNPKCSVYWFRMSVLSVGLTDLKSGWDLYLVCRFIDFLGCFVDRSVVPCVCIVLDSFCRCQPPVVLYISLFFAGCYRHTSRILQLVRVGHCSLNSGSFFDE